MSIVAVIFWTSLVAFPRLGSSADSEPPLIGVLIDTEVDQPPNCFLADETPITGTFTPPPFLPLVNFGATASEITSPCGSPVLGPFAHGKVALETKGAARVWRMQSDAVVSGGGTGSNQQVFASSGVMFLDDFRFARGTSQLPPDGDVPLFFRMRIKGTVINAFTGTGASHVEAAQSRIFADFFRRPPGGVFNTDLQFPPGSIDVFFERHVDGSDDTVIDITLPPSVHFDDELAVATGFAFVSALQGGNFRIGIPVSASPRAAHISVEFSLCSSDSGVRITSAAGAIGDCKSEGDLKLVSVEPVQSVFGASRLISGKDTVIAVDIANTNSVPVEATIQWSVQQGGAPVSFTDSVSIPADCPAKRIYLPNPDPAFMNVCDVASEPRGSLRPLNLAPLEGADYRVILQIHASFATDPDKTNDSFDHSYPVKRTQFAPAFTQISCEVGNCRSGYGAIPAIEFQDAVLWGNLQTLAMFPIGSDPGDFTPSVCGDDACVVPGDAQQCVGPTFEDCPGMIADFKTTRRILKRKDSLATVYATYVSRNYFVFHGYKDLLTVLTLAGLTVRPSEGDNVSFIRSDLVAGTSFLFRGENLAITPHEIVHNLRTDNVHIESASAGFWVGCPYGSCVAGQDSLMRNGQRLPPPIAWIDNGTYESVLGELKVLPDPTILDVTGTVTRAGVVSIDHVAELPAGRQSRSHGTASSIVVLDANGTILSEVSGADDFDHPTSEPDAQPANNLLVIGASLSYPPSAVTVEFRRGATVLLRIDPLSSTLRSAIQSIPDRGFDKNPTERRNALIAKVDALEKALAKKAYTGALNQLQKDIRDKVQKWVLPSYPHPSILESTQPSVLAQIDSVAARINYLQSASGKKAK